MKRSRFHHFGLDGLCLRKSRHSTSAISAMPIGAPGCPETAAWTASMESARMALASVRRVGVVVGVSIKGAHCPIRGDAAATQNRTKRPAAGGLTGNVSEDIHLGAANAGEMTVLCAAGMAPRGRTPRHARSARTTHLSDNNGADTRITARI